MVSVSSVVQHSRVIPWLYCAHEQQKWGQNRKRLVPVVWVDLPALCGLCNITLELLFLFLILDIIRRWWENHVRISSQMTHCVFMFVPQTNGKFFSSLKKNKGVFVITWLMDKCHVAFNDSRLFCYCNSAGRRDTGQMLQFGTTYKIRYFSRYLFYFGQVSFYGMPLLVYIYKVILDLEKGHVALYTAAWFYF